MTPRNSSCTPDMNVMTTMSIKAFRRASSDEPYVDGVDCKQR